MQETIRTLTWAFIHSLWQGLLAALLAAIIISSTRKATARLRYNLLGIVMFLFFAASLITFITQWHTEAKPATASSFTITDDAPVINSTSALMDNFIAWVNANSDIVILAWAFFFLLRCLRLVTGLATVNQLRHYKTHPVTIEWKAKLEQLQLVMGVRRSVTLLQSELAKVPMALGILKPVILIPLGLLTHLPAEQVETILLHELAHIRRRDYLVNLLQLITEAIFFFNPAMRWLSYLIRQEREACCDDMVVARCNQKSNYLNALISFQEYSPGRSSYAMGISGKRHYLLNRVKRMITNKNRGINFFEKTALLAGVLLFSAFRFATQEKEEARTTPAMVKEPSGSIMPVVIAKPEQPSVKKEKKKTIRLNRPFTDTLPPKKKDTEARGNNIPGNKSLPTLEDWEQAASDADATLQEIVEIKNQIGIKKDSIGVKKEQLKTKDGREKEKILSEINRERGEIEDKRGELERKRAQWESLKKEAQKKLREKNNAAIKTVTDKANFATIQNSNDEKTSLIKPPPISADFKVINFKMDNSKLEKQEFKYEKDLQLKIAPPPAGSRSAPEKFKNPEAPAKKVWQ